MTPGYFSLKLCAVTFIVSLCSFVKPIYPIAAAPDETESVAQPNAETSSEPRILVLLVGVTDYPTLKPRQQLKGPGNDIVLIESLLEAAFQKQIAHKVILREQADEKLLPTHANIEREFGRLAKLAESGDQVLILFAGHGSQQPDLDGDEDDRFDEILLPRDIGVWDGVGKAVQNAITDDQIHEWLVSIRRKGAFVFFVADACHTGSMARGDEALARTVQPEDLNVPDSVTRGIGTPGKLNGHEPPDEELPGGLVSLYAARPNESTYEDEIPTRGSLRHGWLTWALCESLSSAGEAMTYADVARRISWQYEQHRWYRSHPSIVGTDLNREFLGAKSYNGKLLPHLKYSKTNGFTITAGRLQGIQPGTVLAVHGPDKKIIGHVKVKNSQVLGSDVEAVAYNDLPVNDTLPPNSECEILYLDFGDQDLKLAVDVSQISSELQQAARERVESELRSIVEENKLAATVVDSAKDAEWLVLVSGDKSVLHLADIQDVQKNPEGRAVQRPGSQWMDISGAGESHNSELSTNLRKMIAASNLRKLARQDAETLAISPIGRAAKHMVSVQLNVEKLVDPERGIFDPVAETGAEVKDKETLRVTIINTSAFPIDITLLYLGNDSSISSFFPQVGDFSGRNRLEPSQSHLVENIKIKDSTIGLEDLIVVAVEANGALPVNFSFLDQAGFKRGARGPVMLASPLQMLLDSRDRGDGRTRGGGTELGNYAIQRFSWTVTK